MSKQLALAAAIAILTPAAQAADAQKTVDSAVHALMPQSNASAATTSMLPGFFEAAVDGKMVYVSADGKFMLRGDLFDLKGKRDLGEAGLANARKQALEKVPRSQRLVFAPENPKYTVTVLTDIDCGYCRKLHSEIAEINRQGIAVEYLFQPRSGLATPSYDKAVSVWCAADRERTFTEVMSGADPAPAQCTNPIAQQYKLGQSLGLVSTPAVIAADGTHLGGYMPIAELQRKLDGVAASMAPK